MFILCLTLILLTWTIWRAPTNASKWRMGFNSAFKGLIHKIAAQVCIEYVVWITSVMSKCGGYLFIIFFFSRCCIKCVDPPSKLTANAEVLRTLSEPAVIILRQAYYPRMHAVAQLVEALRHKPEGRGFDPRWCHWNFSLT